jgi:signal transduction histidine kinase/CheY-like chemotaxis protein/HPt (histidine-containing phosphotransfer) domain-containing protein
MAKFRIEFQIILLVVIIASAVIATGYMAYKSLSEIVRTAQQEATPDHQLFLIKDITADLASLENVVRLYTLTDNEEDIAPYMQLSKNVTEKLDSLIKISSVEYSVLVNNFYELAIEKLEIWHEILNLHQSSKGMDPVFTQIYSKLEYTDVDTVITETRERGFLGGLFGGDRFSVDTLSEDHKNDNQEAKPDTIIAEERQKGFLSGLFKKNTTGTDTTVKAEEVDTLLFEEKNRGFFSGLFSGSKRIRTDTLLIEKKLERADIKNELHHLESFIREKDAQISHLESELIERNGEIGKRLNHLIVQRENFEAESRLVKTAEADLGARLTYKRMAAFSATALLLLLFVIFIFYNYQRSSRAYQLAQKRARLEAEKLASAREQFAANVSHELRTPVNAIYNLSEQLIKQTAPGQLKNQLAILARSAGHLKSIINDTLDFSKIQANKLRIDSVHFSPSSVFEEVISIQKTEAVQKGIDLIYRRLPPIPHAVVGDPLRLKQILINLVGNAIKFTEKGHVVIEVRSGIVAGNKTILDFRITDTGIGISEENLEIIFDEFVQAENGEGKKYRGTGLGLSIVKKLVEMQDGKITVESKLHEGTSFSVVIPYLKGDPEKIAVKEHFIPHIPPYFRQSTVLIADDEQFNRYVLKNLLDKWGVRHEEAVDGMEAVQKALKRKFDVILLDMRMPGKSGLEAAKEILRNDPGAKIVAVTAADRTTDRDACIHLGMRGYLLKPFSENDLFNVIHPLLENSHLKSIRKKHFKITPAALDELGNGDPEFLKEMILLFIKTSEDGLKQIEKAVDRKDWDSVTETAHKMAAPSKYIHADDLYEKLKSLEFAPQNPGDTETLSCLYAEVKEEAGEVIDSLKSFLLEWNSE